MSGNDAATRTIEGEAPTTEDGRNIDSAFGTLSGEGASIVAKKPDVAWPIPEKAHAVEASTSTYYEQPALKEPVWKAYIPTYFFTGGVAGATATLGAAIQLFGGRHRRVRKVVHAARWTSAVAIAVSAGCLVADLGRPSRFLNMLRVFRPTSPMNVGTWLISASGATTTAAAVLPLLGRRAAKIADVAAIGAGAFGVPLAGYTAVLIANTAVPIWQEGARSLPALFYASAAASGAAAIELVPGVTSLGGERVRRMLTTFGTIGKVAELAVGFAWEHEVSRKSARVAEPLKRGLSGKLWTASKILTGSSLVVSLLARRPRTRAAAAVLASAGALALRFAVMEAGKASARDPRATFEPQRATWHLRESSP